MCEHYHSHLILILILVNGTNAQPSPPPVSAIENKMWDPSLAVIIIGLVGIFLLYSLFSFYLSRCSHSSFNPYYSSHNPRGIGIGIHPELLHTFPTLFFSTINHLRLSKGSLECAVCLTEFTHDDTLRLLPQCNHVFHPPCIDEWLSSHVTCPLCRADLTQDVEQVPIPMNEGESVRSREQEREMRNEQCECGREEGKKRMRRANTTGHSVVECREECRGECMERYTLRLPEEVRKYIMLNHGVMLQRSASYNVAMQMQRRGGFMCWSDSEGSSGKSTKPK